MLLMLRFATLRDSMLVGAAWTLNDEIALMASKADERRIVNSVESNERSQGSVVRLP